MEKERHLESLHITLPFAHPAFEWVSRQADQIGASGHVGTHLDCYLAVPSGDTFRMPGIVLDCKSGMPGCQEIRQLPPLEGKALLLYTGNMEQNTYGSPEYWEYSTALAEPVLEALLQLRPQFLVVDSHGIGAAGEEHIRLDKLCEMAGCHVIENADFRALQGRREVMLEVMVDLAHPSSGKPCRLYC